MKRFVVTLNFTFLFCSLFSQSVNFTSSNLPVIVINTNGQDIPDDPKITADMGIIDNGPGKRNNITDTFSQYKGKIGIEIRGQSSQMFPMKSYSIELRDIAGKSVDKSIFGMPKESDWVLYAPYTDKTLMRNVLAYTISRELGHWAPRCVMVEMVINGDYRGVYVFMEKIKRNSGRVNIPKMAKTDTSGDALTGGYIFSLDKEPDGWFSSYRPPNSTNSATRQFSYVYPKLADIVQQQKDYVKNYVDSFENVLAGPDYQDPVKGVRRYADLSSFIDYFIVNEVSRNVDGYRLSTYLHKDRNSKDRRIVAGPVWDYDLAFRNADYCSGSDTRGWAYKFNEVCPGDGAGLIPFWWNRLMTDTAFLGNLRCRWKETRKTSVSLDRLNKAVDSIASVVDEAQKRHFTRWPILGVAVWPNPKPIPASYAEEISTLKNWVQSRLDWLDLNMPDYGACADFFDVTGTMKVSAYPNPVTDATVVRVKSIQNQKLEFRVIDMYGHIVQSSVESVIRGENTIQLHTAKWAAGTYFLELRNQQGEKFSGKFLKL